MFIFDLGFAAQSGEMVSVGDVVKLTDGTLAVIEAKEGNLVFHGGGACEPSKIVSVEDKKKTIGAWLTINGGPYTKERPIPNIKIPVQVTHKVALIEETLHREVLINQVPYMIDAFYLSIGVASSIPRKTDTPTKMEAKNAKSSATTFPLSSFGDRHLIGQWETTGLHSIQENI